MFARRDCVCILHKRKIFRFMKIFFLSLLLLIAKINVLCLRATSTKKTFCGFNYGTHGPCKLKSVFNQLSFFISRRKLELTEDNEAGDGKGGYKRFNGSDTVVNIFLYLQSKLVFSSTYTNKIYRFRKDTFVCNALFK